MKGHSLQLLDEQILSENLKYSKDLNLKKLAELKDPNKNDLAVSKAQLKKSTLERRTCDKNGL
jgi:hypothetical protein